MHYTEFFFYWMFRSTFLGGCFAANLFLFCFVLFLTIKKKLKNSQNQKTNKQTNKPPLQKKGKMWIFKTMSQEAERKFFFFFGLA